MNVSLVPGKFICVAMSTANTYLRVPGTDLKFYRTTDFQLIPRNTHTHTHLPSAQTTNSPTRSPTVLPDPVKPQPPHGGRGLPAVYQEDRQMRAIKWWRVMSEDNPKHRPGWREDLSGVRRAWGRGQNKRRVERQQRGVVSVCLQPLRQVSIFVWTRLFTCNTHTHAVIIQSVFNPSLRSFNFNMFYFKFFSEVALKSGKHSGLLSSRLLLCCLFVL